MLERSKAVVDYRPTNENSDMEEIIFKKYKPSKKNLPQTEWYKDIAYKYATGASSAFLVYGNVHDQAIPGYDIVEYLKEKFTKEFKIYEISVFDLVSTNYSYYYPKNDFYTFEYRLTCLAQMLEFNYHRSDMRKAAIIKFPEYLFPNRGCPEELYCRNITKLLNIIDKIKETGNILIILADNKLSINQSLLNTNVDMEAIEVPYPTVEQREKMLNYLEQNSQRLKLKGLCNLKELARVATGFTLNDLEKLWRLAIPNEVLTLDSVKEYKANLFKKQYENILDVYEPNSKYSLDTYAGMACVKDYLKEGVINPIKKGDKDIIPKGLLLMGSAGTGKTYLAKCLASESGINFAEIKLSKFISKWVGESEQNLEKIFACVKSLAPCFVFVDEIDQVLQRGDEDCNGVRGTIFQMFMNFLSDAENRGDIIFIAATNYPNKLDEALKRAGRFDIKLVFTPPVNIDEIDEVLDTHLNFISYPVAIEKSNPSYRTLLNKLDGYSQAEIEAVVVKALSLARRRKNGAITVKLLLEATDYVKKSLNNEETKKMIKIAIEECSDLEFLSKEMLDKYYNENDIDSNTW